MLRVESDYRTEQWGGGRGLSGLLGPASAFLLWWVQKGHLEGDHYWRNVYEFETC